MQHELTVSAAVPLVREIRNGDGESLQPQPSVKMQPAVDAEGGDAADSSSKPEESIPASVPVDGAANQPVTRDLVCIGDSLSC